MYLMLILSAIVYSIVFYVKHSLGDNPEKYDPVKLAATIFVGVVVAVAMTLTGNPLDQLSFTEQMIAYMGIIAVVEAILKSILRAINKVSATVPSAKPPSQ